MEINSPSLQLQNKENDCKWRLSTEIDDSLELQVEMAHKTLRWFLFSSAPSLESSDGSHRIVQQSRISEWLDTRSNDEERRPPNYRGEHRQNDSDSRIRLQA